MANLPSLEKALAAAVNAWVPVAQELNPAARARQDELLNEALEGWLGALVPTDPRWTLGEWWTDEIGLFECRALEDGYVSLAGWVWEIDSQEKFPFKALIRTRGPELAEYEVHFGDERPRAERPRRGEGDWRLSGKEPKWIYRFQRLGRA